MPKQTVIILVAVGIAGGVLVLVGLLGAAGALLWFTQRSSAPTPFNRSVPTQTAPAEP